jgi:transcription elongation GreA/GreB family factor
VSVDARPARLITEHPNLVTAAVLKHFEAAGAGFVAAHGAAQAAGDREAMAATARDLRYWSTRLGTAELVRVPADGEHVHFGSTVTIEREDGRRQTYRIVGEDEADPAKGSVSFVSPLARSLVGKAVGDTVKVAGADAEIVALA